MGVEYVTVVIREDSKILLMPEEIALEFEVFDGFTVAFALIVLLAGVWLWVGTACPDIPAEAAELLGALNTTVVIKAESKMLLMLTGAFISFAAFVGIRCLTVVLAASTCFSF